MLEKQRVENRFASDEVHIDHLFYNVNATVSFGNRLNILYSNIYIKIFHRTDKLTNKLTDGQNQLLNPFVHAHVK